MSASFAAPWLRALSRSGGRGTRLRALSRSGGRGTRLRALNRSGDRRSCWATPDARYAICPDAELCARHADAVAVAQLAPPPKLWLVVDRNLRLPEQQLGLAARVNDPGELQQRTEADHGAADLHFVHPLTR